MKDKEISLDVLEKADDEEIRRIAADCPASPEEKERMFKLSQKIYNERTNESKEAPAEVVTGVEQYKKPVWSKILSAAAAFALVVGLGTGGWFMFGRNGLHKHFENGDATMTDEAVNNNTAASEVSNYPFGRIDRVRMSNAAIAPAAIELESEDLNKLISMLDELPWEDLGNKEPAEGEVTMLFVYNNGDPYMLMVMADGSVAYCSSTEDGSGNKLYAGSEKLSQFLYSIELDPEKFLYDIDDMSEEDIIGEVWTYEHKDISVSEGFFVPDMYYKKAELAKQELTELGIKYEVEEIESTEIQPNYVVKTEPKAGTEIKKGGKVTLYVSKGAGDAKITVNDFTGRSLDEAEIMAGYQGFKIYTENVVSDEPVGTVVGQEPRAGTEVQQGSDITFFVSGQTDTVVMDFGLPEGNGRYIIDIVYTDDNGRKRARSSGNIILSDVRSCTVTAEGSGSSIKCSAVLTNIDNDKKADIGRYTLNFDNGTYTTESEDIKAAFDAVQ